MENEDKKPVEGGQDRSFREPKMTAEQEKAHIQEQIHRVKEQFPQVEQEAELCINTDVFTFQIDLCHRIALKYQKKSQLHDIVQAGVRQFDISFVADESVTLSTGYDVLKVDNPEINDKTDQFITRWIDGVLKTEEIVRYKNGYPTTQREMDEFNEKKEDDAELAKQEVEKLLKFGGPLGMDEASLKTRSKVDEEQQKKIDQANLLKMQGNKKFLKKEYTKAEALYTRAIENDPSNHLLYSNRAACRFELGRLDEALEDADKSVSIDDEFVKGHVRRGLCLRSLNKLTEAVAALKLAHILDDDDENVLSILRETETLLSA